MSDHQDNPNPSPLVHILDGGVRANSRDIATAFGKRHGDVLRSIRDLIEEAPDLDQRNFASVEYVDGKGEARAAYEMDRDGFTLLAMGFTGAKALQWKLTFIQAFNQMEAALRDASPIAALNDPAAMRGLLLTYAEKQIALQGEIEQMKPQVAAFERIAVADGSLCITDAAKTLQIQPKALFNFLRSHCWIYGRPGNAGDVAYQAKLQSGLLEHKTTTVNRSDGSEKVVTQVRVTPKGLARLAKELPPVAKAA